MLHQRKFRARQSAMIRAFAAFYADSIEYDEDHLKFLRLRRDNYLKSLRT